MLPDLLVDAVVGAALHREDHVHRLRVRERHVLLVLRVAVPRKPNHCIFFARFGLWRSFAKILICEDKPRRITRRKTV